MKPKNRFAICLAVCACLFLPAPADALGQNPADPRKPLIYGICEKPFPAIFSLDYPLCRASAWLEALERASRHLPPAIASRLKQQGISPALAQMALCARLCPVDVVTPEKAPGDRIRVFLFWPDDPESAAQGLLDQHWQLMLEMALIEDTREALAKLRASWPKSVERSDVDFAGLEKLARLLDDLWTANEFLTGASKPARSVWKDAFSAGSPAASISLARAWENARSGPEQLADCLLELEKREVADHQNPALWNWLICQALYLRGLALAERNQSALAEADFNTALARLKKTGAPVELAADIYLARGKIHELRHETARMCADYISACARGRCEALSLARRSGICLQD